MKKLFEIRVEVSYAIVIAADNEADALDHVTTWEESWDTHADLIGVSSPEIVEVREPLSEELEDEAHVIIGER